LYNQLYVTLAVWSFPLNTERRIDMQIMSILGPLVHDQFWTYIRRPN